MTAVLAADTAPQYGIAMHGEPLRKKGFDHFPYVNPDAPKGGRLVLGERGSFDSLNPLIVMGHAAEGIRDYVYESLMTRAYDEPFTLYGRIAETIQTPSDRSSVTFQLNPKAKFSDGQPVTPKDVIFSYELLREHGRPNHRTYYAKVTEAEQIGAHGVKFTFEDASDREMPLIMGLMPVLPSHLVDPESFEKTGFEIPVGSGPYLVKQVDPGKSITYERDPDYWGKDLNVNKGRFNFDKIRIEYYRDTGAMFEAFKSGLIDFREEEDPTWWTESYDFPAVARGRVVKEALPIEVPAGMSALVFNTRRPQFADPRIRQSLIALFDFDWINRTLYHGQYSRTESYFARSDLSSHGRPADAYEKTLLAPYADDVLPEIMDGTYVLHQSDGRGQNRAGRREAIKLFQEAGYVLKGGRLVDEETGKPFAIEILAATRPQERLLLTYARALKQVGITVRIRQVDSAQYQRRKQTFDFDMIQYYWPVSLSPGNEQLFRWGSEAAVTDGSFNYPGIRSEAVDAMIAAMLHAKSREDFVSSVRALDRVLLSGRYVLPLFHLPKQWVAYWRKLHRPEQVPIFGYILDTWWAEPAKGGAQ
ncbi:MAG: extracellular solute-binding protein [Methyloligella sp. ZOD6]